jgi:hypothetical protein
MTQVIRRGIMASFDTTTWTASVIIVEATNAYLNSVPCATSLNTGNAVPAAECAVLFFDENNSDDAVVLAVYNTTAALDSGSIVFTTGTKQINAVLINSGNTTTFTIVGTGGVPIGAAGIIFSAEFSSPTAGAEIYIAPKGATLGNYFNIGWLAAANLTMTGSGVMKLSTDGKIDIKAIAGNCTVTLYTHGYIPA